MSAGREAPKDLRAGAAHDRRGIGCQNPFACGVDANDAPIFVDLDDDVGCPVEDGRKLVPLTLERLAHLRRAEGNGQLMARQHSHAQPVGIERSTQRDLEGQQGRGSLVPQNGDVELRALHGQAAPSGEVRQALRRPPPKLAGGGKEVELRSGGGAEPNRSCLGACKPDELYQDSLA